MKVVTYNINSIRARANNLFSWLRDCNPDVVFLQEIKCEDNDFPALECESLGYKVATLGQKSYNGVAILCKYDFEITQKNLPNFDDEAARYIEILVKAPLGNFYAVSIYAPNGCSTDKAKEIEKLKYKIKWYNKFYNHISSLLASSTPVIVGGDFNIIKEEIDVFDCEKFKTSPLYVKEVRDIISSLEFIGMHDAFRLFNKNNEGYTFWDYTGNSFVTNLGLRIDYMLISASFAENILEIFVDKSLRTMEKPSDHTALVAVFKD